MTTGTAGLAGVRHPDPVDRPFSRHALECGAAVVPEVVAGADEEISDRLRDEHVTRSTHVLDAGAYGDRHPPDLSCDDLALARMDPHTNVDAERVYSVADRETAVDGSRRR